MTGLSTDSAGLTLALQSRSAQPAQFLQALNDAQAARTTGAETTVLEDDAEARDAANKFEALLIHNLLKTMRKTTMAENKSNDQAIYEDMFDEKIASTMMEAGGIGVADQILAQIRQQRGQATTQAETDSDTQKLRELARHITAPTSVSPAAGASGTSKTENLSAPASSVSSSSPLGMVSTLWGDQSATPLTQQQQNFVAPLAPHARRNAQKLGTAPQAILAIAALETGWGQSLITDKNGVDSHNLFGIKASASDQRYATIMTTEYLNGSPQKQQARFKAFDSSADAVDGFADFILSNPRYTRALQNASDPEQFLTELQNAGYATDPRYADKAISIMRQITGNPLPL